MSTNLSREDLENSNYKTKHQLITQPLLFFEFFPVFSREICLQKTWDQKSLDLIAADKMGWGGRFEVENQVSMLIFDF